MTNESNPSDEFDEIISHNNMEHLYGENGVMTIQDVYEGLAILSNLQADMHRYLRDVMMTIYQNTRSGKNPGDFPQLSNEQVLYLEKTFNAAAQFLEEPGV